MVYPYNGHPSWTNHRCEKLAQSFYAVVPVVAVPVVAALPTVVLVAAIIITSLTRLNRTCSSLYVLYYNYTALTY